MARPNKHTSILETARWLLSKYWKNSPEKIHEEWNFLKGNSGMLALVAFAYWRGRSHGIEDGLKIIEGD